MRPITKQIYDLINNEELNASLQNHLDTNLSYERNEMTLKEVIDNFYYMKEIISEACENEQINKLPLAYKRQISSTLNTIVAHRTSINTLMDYINNLYVYFLTYNLDKFKNDNAIYEKELLNAIKEKNEYRKISSSLRKGIKWVNEIEPKMKRIIELEAQVTNSVEIIESSRKLINDLKENILNITKDVDSKKIVIDNTFESAAETRETLKNAEKNISSLESGFNIKYDTFLKNSITKNDSIQKQNSIIQEKVNELLQGATAGKLHEGFNTRKKELQKTLNVWLFGIIILNIMILLFSFTLIYGVNSFNIGPFVPNDNYFPEIKAFIIVASVISFILFLIKKYIFKQDQYSLKIPQYITSILIIFLIITLAFDGITIPSISKIEFGQNNIWTPLIKLLITIPLIVLDWFLIKEYSYRKDFVEKYTFKSAISLSLFAYKDLIKNENENSESLKFINTAIEKIYKDPFENDKYSLAKKEKDLLSSLVENLSNKISGS